MGILEEIQSLVHDKLQVVSYKWLSRKFSVSSNDAKRMLQDFVGNRGTGIEVLYSLSGWMKNDPSVYHIRLVSKPKLAEAKQELDENWSIQIYSIQACLPKDPAVLWNAEFVQAEELFKQPHAVDNCLRDNRFCGISNSFVKRNGGGTQGDILEPEVKNVGALGPRVKTLANQSPTLPQPQQKRTQESNRINRLQSPDMGNVVKNNSHVTGTREQSSKSALDKEKVSELPVNKKKVPDDTKSAGNGGVLANMWVRASAKSKAECASAGMNNIHNSSDAQICGREEVEHESSDDEGQGVNIKRSRNVETARKRKVVFDYSDEEDEYKDAVNLASPDPPKKESTVASKQTFHPSDLEKSNLNFEEAKEDFLGLTKDDNTKASSLEKGVKNLPVGPDLKAKIIDTAPKSPKRRKILKTRIDERGREVTEVVWEGDEEETKSDRKTMKATDNIAESNIASRPAAIKKSSAVGNTAPLNQVAKAGNKKAANKDPKQGNILSFFKRV